MESPLAMESAQNPEEPSAASYGLRPHILSPLETLAQSISTIAPCTTPPLTIPLVFALAGNGTWLAYALALAGLFLIALCIAAFARDSASPGSLYVYTRNTLPPAFSAVSAWALLFAYITTASSVTGGFIVYSYVLLKDFGLTSLTPHTPAVLLATLCAGGSAAIAYRDIKISAQLMLWIEVVSVCLITLVVGLVLLKHGPHLDRPQFTLQGASTSGIRLGMMLAIFSFVGFESATTLGAEARNPLKTIPRAVIRSAALAGIFFVVSAYGEVLGFRSAPMAFNQNPAPMTYLATQSGIGWVGRIIDLGVLVSMFAATLGCVIAAARVLMLMAHNGLAHKGLTKTHEVNDTPGIAGLVTGLLALAPVAFLALRHKSPDDIYGWMGTLAVFGFLTAYALVAIALPVHLKRTRRLHTGWVLLSIAATGAVLLAVFGTLYPIPDAPYRYFPYLYAAYLACGLLWYLICERRKQIA
jgi:amino acid transporter